MKYAYICEKCGKQFDDYDAAISCEQSHREVEVIDSYCLDEKTRKQLYSGKLWLQHFDQGSTIPDTVWLRAPLLDEDGSVMYDEYGPMYEAVPFTRVPMKKSTRQIADSMTIAMHRASIEQARERDLWLAASQTEV